MRAGPDRRRFIALTAAGLAGAAPARAAPPAAYVFYACQAGQEALDEGFGGGNPFARAFIDLLAMPALPLAEAPGRMRDMTAALSDGFQAAETPAGIQPADYRLADPGTGRRRVALVMIESLYGAPGVPVLPGAARDGLRVAEALRAAGFATAYEADLDRPAMLQVLADFAVRSRNAEAAVIYSTGHGVQSGGAVRLLATDYVTGRGEARLGERSVAVPELADAARARTINLVFWAGCRSPFTY